MSKKPALGKGLGALLQNAETDITLSSDGEDVGNVLGAVSSISISDIEANPFQPRTQFEKDALIDLSNSIKELGIIQPVTVRKLGYGKYQLISGERRFRAAQIVGLKEIPSFIRVANDKEMLEMALVENIQRQDLDAMEVAFSYQKLIDECGLTQEELSERVGKKRSTISNYLRLLKLPARIQLSIRTKDISMGHARALVTIESESEQMRLANRIMGEGLSVRQVEELIKGRKEPINKKKAKAVSRNLSFTHQKIKEDLSEFLGANVQLNPTSGGAGSLIIKFNSEEDLERMVELFGL